MLTGIQLYAHPTASQKQVLSQWMGCARVIWNAKCEDEKYLTTYARKYLPIGTYAPINQSYSQYKSKILTPWLFSCPSQILRNSVVNWYQTYQRFMGGLCGKPQRKIKAKGGSIHLTNELFSFVVGEDGVTRLFIGSKRNNIGFLSIKNHKNYAKPKSLYIKQINGKYTVSFCYEEAGIAPKYNDNIAHLAYLQTCEEAFLQAHTVGIDRGVAIPAQVGDTGYDFTAQQKNKKTQHEKYIKRHQRKMARQNKGSNRRQKTKNSLARRHRKIKNIREDFCHQTSRKIVDNSETKIIIFEDLKTHNMTKKPQAKPKEKGNGWEKNKARAKAGLNKAILDKGWNLLETFVSYKALHAGKAVFRIPAHYTSQECADCGYTHPDNRKTQSEFICGACGHTDNSDKNAALVLKKRAITLLLHSGTELSKRGVLVSR